ncbi:MAG TPA: IS200/IS605 family transposase [Thermoanaerobaculia bacterium]
MAHTYTSLLTHIVFGTLNRWRCIDGELRTELYPYCRAIVRALKCETIEIGGGDDHLHLFARIHPSVALADFVGTIKSNSSRWAHDKWPRRRFGWQVGYSAFSVDRGRTRSLSVYIRNQEEHHRTQSFGDEYRDSLRANGIAFDPRYVMD